MVEHFGSLSEYMNAPYWLAKKHMIILRAKWSAEAEMKKRHEREMERIRNNG